VAQAVSLKPGTGAAAEHGHLMVPIQVQVPFAKLALAEQADGLHVATCALCRSLTVKKLLNDPPSPDPLADIEAVRLRKRFEDTDLTGKALAIDRERREAAELVSELRAQPESWGTAPRAATRASRFRSVENNRS
jgi:hypothetical protein